MTRLIRLLVPAALALIPLALPVTGMAATGSTACDDERLIPDGSNAARIRAATLCLLNAERARRDLDPLTADMQLRKAAEAYSTKMVRLRFFDHVCPQGSTPVSRVKRGTRYLRGSIRRWALGENIGWGSADLASPREIVAAWMRSSGHRHNILHRRFDNVGIGVATGAPDDVDGLPAATYTTEFGFRIKG